MGKVQPPFFLNSNLYIRLFTSNERERSHLHLYVYTATTTTTITAKLN